MEAENSDQGACSSLLVKWTPFALACQII